ncbi:MAG: PHP domain-containing protein [Oscillospiraceae bacterium]|nr:PHP domain-containing protein [Oscillospiraceae bacterium]
MKKYLLPENGKFYKANLHCHSTISDGALTPAEIKKHYMAHGYSVVAYTDHDIMIPHDDLADENFLPLHGYEMEINEIWGGDFSLTKTCHMCLIALEPDNLKQACWHRETYLFGNAPKYRGHAQFYEDEPDYVRTYTPECISDMMRKGREKGFFVTYNHPIWSMETRDQYINYHNMHAMEICNYGCVVAGYEDYVPAIYDEMLRSGKRIYCIATDDNHNHGGTSGPNCDSFGGFTMIKADKLDYRTITSALEQGHFYASQGPCIKSLWYEDGKMHIECEPVKSIIFSSDTRWMHTVHAPEGAYLTCAEVSVPENGVYVRVTVIDENGKPANTNAYFVDELKA